MVTPVKEHSAKGMMRISANCWDSFVMGLKAKKLNFSVYL